MGAVGGRNEFITSCVRTTFIRTGQINAIEITLTLTKCSAFIIRIKYSANSQFSEIFPDIMFSLPLFGEMLSCCKNV